MDTAVSPKVARRQGGTKEHVQTGPVTEEQRSRRATFGETLRAEGLLARFFVVPHSQIRSEMLARLSANQPKTPLSCNVHSSLTGCQRQQGENNAASAFVNYFCKCTFLWYIWEHDKRNIDCPGETGGKNISGGAGGGPFTFSVECDALTDGCSESLSVNPEGILSFSPALARF